MDRQDIPVVEVPEPVVTVANKVVTKTGVEDMVLPVDTVSQCDFG